MRRRSRNSVCGPRVTSTAEFPCSATPTTAPRCARDCFFIASQIRNLVRCMYHEPGLRAKNRSGHRLSAGESVSPGEVGRAGAGGLLFGVSLPPDFWRGVGRNAEQLYDPPAAREGGTPVALFRAKPDRYPPGVRLFIAGHVFAGLPGGLC